MSNIPRVRYTVAEAAESLGIGKTQLNNLIAEGHIVVHQDTPGGHRYVSQRSIDDYIRSREEQPVFGRRRVS